MPELNFRNGEGFVHSKPAETRPRITVVPSAEPAGTKQRLVTVKDALWFVYLYPLRFLAAVLPCGALRLAGRLAEPVYQFVTRKQKQVVTARLALANGGGVSPAARRETVRRFVANAVVRAVDDLILDRLIARRRLVCAELRGLDHLSSARAAGKGVVVVTGHFYANRLAKRHLTEIGYPMMSVRNSQPYDEMMGRLGERYLQPRYIEFLHGIIRDEVSIQDPECALKILARLRSGGLVNVHVDAPLSRDLVTLPFLGRQKRFPTGILRIIRLSGCAVIPMMCLGDSRRFTITFDEPIDLVETDTLEEFVSVNLPRMTAKLESQILSYPDQWELWTRL